MSHYFKVRITRERDREDGDKNYPASRTILEQEIDQERFDLTAVIQAINLREFWDLRKSLGPSEYASTPHRPEPEPEHEELIEIRRRIKNALALIDPGAAVFPHDAVEIILRAVFPGYLPSSADETPHGIPAQCSHTVDLMYGDTWPRKCRLCQMVFSTQEELIESFRGGSSGR